MRNEERGARSEEGGELPQVLHSLDPQSSIPDPVFMARVRWRCRRGLLELDIVLGRFIERHYAGLDDAGLVAFDALLDMPDTLLWDMIASRGSLPQASSQLDVLRLLQAE